MKYRVFGKKREQLRNKATFFDEVLSAEINEDLLQATSSTITCANNVDAMEEGDIVCLYNDKGEQMFLGVVASVEENRLTVGQMQSFFAVNFYARTDSSNEKSFFSPYNSKTMLDRYLNHVANGYLTSRARISGGTEYLDIIPSDFKIKVANQDLMISSGNYAGEKDMPWRIQDEQIEMEQFIYNCYSLYNLMLHFEMPMGSYTPHLQPLTDDVFKCLIFYPDIGFEIGSPATQLIAPYPTVSIGNNAEFIQNIDVIKEIADANAIHIYDSAGTTFRKAYVVLNNGTYSEMTDSNQTLMNPYRYYPVRVKYVNSGETLSKIVNAELNNVQYNHKVKFDLLFPNNFYNFGDIKLGQKINFYVGNKQYYSVLTGWSYSIDQDKDVSKVSMTCGKVRTSLTSKLNMKK